MDAYISCDFSEKQIHYIHHHKLCDTFELRMVVVTILHGFLVTANLKSVHQLRGFPTAPLSFPLIELTSLFIVMFITSNLFSAMS